MKSLVFSVLLLVGFVSLATGQAYILDATYGNATNISVPPEEVITYSLASSTNLEGCAVVWAWENHATSPTNSSGTYGLSIVRKWANINGSMKLTAKTQNCTHSESNGLEATYQKPIRFLGDLDLPRLNGVAFTTISNTSLPCGTTSVTLSVPTPTTANPTGAPLTYSWNLPSGWTQTGGGNTNSITVTPTAGTGGTITVYVQRNDAVNSVKSSSGIKTRPLPTTPTLDKTKAFLCSGSTVLTASASEATNYLWTASSGLTASSPGNTNSATITGSADGTITVKAYSSTCDYTTGSSSPTTIIGTAPTTGITIKDDFGQNAPNNMSCGYGLTLTAYHPNAEHYSWSFSGNIGSAYTTDYLNGKVYFNSYTNDCYGLTANVTNCIGGGTNGVTICINDCSSGFASYAVYPNPAKETLYLQYDKSSKAVPDLVELLEESSQKVVLEKPGSRGDENSMALNVGALPRGRYVLRVTQKNDKQKPQTNHRIVLE